MGTKTCFSVKDFWYCYPCGIFCPHNLWLTKTKHTHTQRDQEKTHLHTDIETLIHTSTYTQSYLEWSAGIDLSICLPPFRPLVSGEGPDSRIHSGDALHPHQNIERACRHTKHRRVTVTCTFPGLCEHFWFWTLDYGH